MAVTSGDPHRQSDPFGPHVLGLRKKSEYEVTKQKLPMNLNEIWPSLPEMYETLWDTPKLID